MLEVTDLPLSILIVDDDARVRRALARCLQLDGHRVAVVETGTEALAVIGAERWDLICLDAQLPDIPGPELARQIRGQIGGAYTVLVTGFASSFDDTGLLTEGIQAVLPKPWKVDELDLVLHRARLHLASAATIRAA